jgi:hypothetical protein
MLLWIESSEQYFVGVCMHSCCLLDYDNMQFAGLVHIFRSNMSPQSSVYSEYGGTKIYAFS